MRKICSPRGRLARLKSPQMLGFCAQAVAGTANAPRLYSCKAIANAPGFLASLQQRKEHMAKISNDDVLKAAVKSAGEASGWLCWKQDQTAAAVLHVLDRKDIENPQKATVIAELANTSAIRQKLEKAGKLATASKGNFADL